MTSSEQNYRGFKPPEPVWEQIGHSKPVSGPDRVNTFLEPDSNNGSWAEHIADVALGAYRETGEERVTSQDVEGEPLVDVEGEPLVPEFDYRLSDETDSGLIEPGLRGLN